MIALPMHMPVWQAGTSGVPSAATWLTDLEYDADRITWTISDQFGFESASVTLAGTIETAQAWFDQLMASTVLYDPDGVPLFEGFLNSVDAQIGQETHSRSLDGMANRLNVRYTTVLGSPGSSGTSSNTASQLRYGIKDGVERLGETSSLGAQQRRDVMLAERAWPRKRPTSIIATGDPGVATITLNFVGWYGVLDWVLTGTTSTTLTTTTTQVSTLLTNYAAVNAFLSTTTTITASGITDREYINEDTTYRSAIERLLQQGNGTNRYAWGVYEDRVFTAGVWAGASSSSITYLRTIQGEVTDQYGAPIPIWRMRPNAMYAIQELFDLVVNTNEPDAAGRYYVARVTGTVDAQGVSMQLEPSDTNDVTALLARANRG